MRTTPMLDKRPLPPDLRDALAQEPDGAELEAVWHLLGNDAPADRVGDADADWQAVRRRLHAAPAPTRAPVRPDRSARRLRWPVAAALAVALLAVGFWLFTPVTHRAPLGESLAVALPDGSSVTLNSGAQLEHPRRFGRARAVSLAGEAFFDVQKGDVPFVVRTHNARVEVLGTSFNVRAWGEQTTVALVEGRVEVSGAGTTAEVMAPGDVVELAGAAPAPQPVRADADRAAAWRTGALAFDGLPLSAVLEEVERRYAVVLDPAPGTPLGANVSVYYTERPALDALLGDLGAATGVRFVPGAGGYRVQPVPRRSSPRPALPNTAP